MIRHLLADRGLTGKYKIASCLVQERFYSKRNEVSLVKFIDAAGAEREWIVKKFIRPQESLARERAVLRRLHIKGLPAPKLIYTGRDYLVASYIEGVTLLDWLEKKEMEALDEIVQVEVIKTIEGLACWIKNFYEIFPGYHNSNLTLGDVNLRNFILGDKIYGLDFENCRQGRIEEDIGKICAFALTYSPSFTPWKCSLVNTIRKIMSKALDISVDSINLEMLKGLKQLTKRRASRNKASSKYTGK